jgi:hypothetical protein
MALLKWKQVTLVDEFPWRYGFSKFNRSRRITVRLRSGDLFRMPLIFPGNDLTERVPIASSDVK